MRGDTEQQAVMLTMLTPEDFVRKGHPRVPGHAGRG